MILLKPVRKFPQNFPNPVQIQVVEKEDPFYKKGRSLAKALYKEVGKTESLVDGNDYGIVVASKGKVLGNANLQLKKPGKLLKSEVFFGKSHWESYFKALDCEIAEVSALALAQDAPAEMRREIMMMLIVGIQNLCRTAGIKQIATVQHEYLIRLLTKSLKLPFFKNQVVKEPPALYYLVLKSN